jgi:hypothetical protein
MTLDNSGRLLIGTTSSTGVDKVRINNDGTTSYSTVNITNANSTANMYVGVGGNTVANVNLRDNAYIWNAAASALAFGTSDTERMRITSTGNVGIGTAFPLYKLDVSKIADDSQPALRVQGNTFEDSLVQFINTAVGTGGGGAAGITVGYTVSANNNTDANFINCSDAVALRFIVWNNGGIGNFQSNDVDLSDERTKNSITTLESYWDKIKNIEIVKYKYNDQSHDDYNIGVIAQQVEEIAPEFIDNNSWKIKDTEDYYKTVYNKDLQFAAIKVLQEAMIKIEKLEQELEILKNK